MQKDLKTQNDDDFEKLLQDYINGTLDDTEADDDLETSDNLNEPEEGELPFPKEMDDRVARVRLADNQEKHKCMDDIASVDLKLMSDTDHYSDVPIGQTWCHPPSASFLLLLLYRRLLSRLRRRTGGEDQKRPSS